MYMQKENRSLGELLQKTIQERKAFEKEKELVDRLIETTLKDIKNIEEQGMEEYVQSYFNPNSTLSLDSMCMHCRSRPSNMLWLPCRHLCLCLYCNESFMACPICNSPKMANFIVDLPGFPMPSPWI